MFCRSLNENLLPFLHFSGMRVKLHDRKVLRPGQLFLVPTVGGN
jgi:hypothetical protein